MIYNFDFTLQLSYLFFNWDLSCRTSDFSSIIWSFFQHHSRLRGHISKEFRKDFELAIPRSVWWGIWLSVSITWLQAKPTSSAEIEDFFHSRWVASSRDKCWFQAEKAYSFTWTRFGTWTGNCCGNPTPETCKTIEEKDFRIVRILQLRRGGTSFLPLQRV